MEQGETADATASDVGGRNAAPSVATRSLRLALPAVRVVTLAFPKPSAVVARPAPPAVAAPAVGSPRPARPTPPPGPRPPAPTCVPVAERLRSLLQPPIATLLHNQQVNLPFQPFPYQYEGIQFLYSRWSALLGDEMGLGKTMQTILALRLLLRAGLVRSALLVCPKPLMTNWLREFDQWAEEIPVAAVEGGTPTRRNFWLHDHRPVKITNYETLTRDAELLGSGQVRFDLVVLDEAQRIKNADASATRAALGVRRTRSWALTGTPVENRAEDLVSLLNFVNNGRRQKDDSPAALRQEVSLVLLRRTKEAVQSDLPSKRVDDVLVDLGPTQRERYDVAERDGVCCLKDMREAVTIEHVFELIRWLKNICNFDPLTGESAKADRVKADLEEIAASGKKAILFSQYVATLEQLAGELSDFKPLLYHGKVQPKRRDSVIEAFRDEPDRPIMLMSYGTGAVGLNLQFSNYVFLYDRWWNPAVEDQAINRAHRIGQKAPVFVKRFISPGTIEERVAAVLKRKRDLFARLIDGLEPAESVLTEQEVFGLFNLEVRRPAAA